jgi:hypothetical protein
MSMKNSNDTIGNRTRGLAACSAVPQPTASPRAPCVSGENYEISKSGIGRDVNPELREYLGARYLFDSDVNPTGSAQA